MILLDHSAMEMTFDTKDVIYILTFVVSGLVAWFKMQSDKRMMGAQIKSLEEDAEKIEMKAEKIEEKYTESFREAKHSRAGIRKQMDEKFKEIMGEVKSDREKNNDEFKSINSKLDQIIGKLGA